MDAREREEQRAAHQRAWRAARVRRDRAAADRLPNTSYGEDYAVALRVSREYEIRRFTIRSISRAGGLTIPTARCRWRQ